MNGTVEPDAPSSDAPMSNAENHLNDSSSFVLDQLWKMIKSIRDETLFQIPGPHIDHMRGIEKTAERFTVVLVDARLELLQALMALHGSPLDAHAHRRAEVAVENLLEIVRTLLSTIKVLRDLREETRALASQLITT